MKFTKTLASVAAAALAVSSLAVSAFAAQPKVEAVTLNKATNAVQWNVGVLGTAEIKTVELTGTATLGDGWIGGGGSFGFNATLADGTEEWTQIDFALDSNTDTAKTVCDSATGEFTTILTFAEGTKIGSKVEDIAQLGWWWGSSVVEGEYSCAFSDIKVNGESILGAFAPVATLTTTQESESKVTTVAELGAQFDTTDGVIAEWPALPKATIKADGTDATLTYDFSQYGAPVKFGSNYVAINTKLPWTDYDNNTDLYNAKNVQIKSIKFDGVEYGDYSKLALNNEGGDALRITLMNEWNENFAKGKAPLSGIELPAFTKFEITLAVTDATPAETPADPADPSDPSTPGETEDPAEPGASSGTVNPGECSGEPVNPPTGAAVAVIPAVLAAAAVATTGIVLKKRSK